MRLLDLAILGLLMVDIAVGIGALWDVNRTLKDHAERIQRLEAARPGRRGS